MSLLLAEGHVAASQYAVAVTWSEARIVRQRKASEAQTNAIAMQTAIVSVLSKEGGKALKEFLERIGDVG